MINASSEFKRQIANDNRNYQEYADITLKNGTVLHLTNEHLWQGGLSIEDAVSSDNSFDIGAAIINKCTLTINNIYDDFSDYIFEDAEVIAYIGLELPDGTIEKLRKGTFAVDEPKYNGSIITLECLDNMRKFDKLYSESTLKYPATLEEILRDACFNCGVVLLTTTFDNGKYIVQKKPDGDTITFREVISWVAQIACKYAKIDTYGRLFLGWYDEKEITALRYLADMHGNAISKEDGTPIAADTPAQKNDFITGNILGDIHRIDSVFSQDIALDDVIITGISVEEKQESKTKTYLYGEKGYVLSVKDNSFIETGKGYEVAKLIGNRIIGMRFRPATVSTPSDPTRESGDRAYIIDRKQNVYVIYLTNVSFRVGATQKLKCSAETPARNSADRVPLSTRLIAESRRNTKAQITEYDKAVQMLTALITQSFGVFRTEEVLEDGSVIYYLHNKPLLKDSKTIWKMTADAFAVSTDYGKTWNAGIDSSGNAVLNVLSAIGINADWINTGSLSADMIHGGILRLGGKNNVDGAIYVYDSSGNQIGYWTGNGFYAKSGIFAGNLSGAGGTFSGNLSAAGGTFSGDLDAVGGTFDGIMSNGSIVGSVIETESENKNGKITINQAKITLYSYLPSTQLLRPSGYIYPDVTTIPIGNTEYDCRSFVLQSEEDSVLELYAGNSKVMQAIPAFEDVTTKAYFLNDVDIQGVLWVESHATIGGNLYVDGIVDQGGLTVEGATLRAVNTENYSERILNSYETTTPMFGDIGTGVTDDNGICYVSIDDIFSEIISGGAEYFVFLQREGPGDIWVDSKESAFFVVKGTPNIPFSWEIKAVQKGSDTDRLNDYGIYQDLEVVDPDDLTKIGDSELVKSDAELKNVAGALDESLNQYEVEMEETLNEDFESVSGN